MRTVSPRSPFCLLVCAWTAALGASACSPEATEPKGSALAETGRGIYLNVCIACHNADPSVDGTLGPAIAGSSEALLVAKVVNGTYPPGYTPKRPGSAAMPKFPYLADQIPAIAAYLAEFEPAPSQ